MATKAYQGNTHVGNSSIKKGNIAQRQSNAGAKHEPATKPVVNESDLSQKNSSNVGKGPAGENL
jgi:hypothetical protein